MHPAGSSACPDPTRYKGYSRRVERIALLVVHLVVIGIVLFVSLVAAESILEFKAVTAHQIANRTVDRIRRLIVVQRHSLAVEP